MSRIHFILLLVLIVLVPLNAFATPPLEWSLQNGRDINYRPDQNINRSISIAPRMDREYDFETNYNYFFELKQIAEFLVVWQEDDPTSPDFGGMIEAEAGELADVIQTDNTLEAIIVWCRYAQVFGDTATYGDNVRKAWIYSWRYPAWEEEGDPGEDYYRNHNCAWGVWAAQSYEEAYGDTSHADYATQSANYMVDHPMPFSVSGSYAWINPFVTGWMAGNLYHYGEALQNQAYMDTAVGMGNRLIDWFDVDPETRLAEERWAMSSGTAVWGVCNSVFKADPQQGIDWIEDYGSMVDEFQPWRNAPDDGFDWDNSWNVAYANAHHAMYLISDNDQYGANFQALTDTLLSYDTDDDGGIPATTRDPVTEDMCWVSSYLWLMGVHGVATHLPNRDAGILALDTYAQHPPYHTGDSLVATCTVSNFGWDELTDISATLTLVDPCGNPWPFEWFGSLQRGENEILEMTWLLNQPGTHQIIAEASCSNDEGQDNGILTLTVEVVPEVQVAGTLFSSVTGEPIYGRIIASYLTADQAPAPYDTCWTDPVDGTWSLLLPHGDFQCDVDPRLPYPSHVETLHVTEAILDLAFIFDHVADIILVDDDNGEDLEDYILASCDSIALIARAWDRFTSPVPPVHEILEFPGIPIVWLTGLASEDALLPEEQDSLVLFVDQGGQLLLSGQNILEYCGDGVLFRDIFPLDYIDDTFDHILDLDQEDPFNSGYDRMGTAGQGSANNQSSQEVISTELIPPGTDYFPFASYSEGNVAGVRIHDDTGRRIFLGFGLEGVGLPNQPAGFMPRHVLLSRSLAWLSGAAIVSPDIQPPVPQRAVLTVGPNPSANQLTVTFSQPGAPSMPPVRLFDLAGRMVDSFDLVGEPQLAEATIDLSRFPAGTYVCSAGNAKRVKIVIVR